MHWIAWHGHTEIFKFLALLTDDPNPPVNIGRTPYMVARVRRSKEIQKFLQNWIFINKAIQETSQEILIFQYYLFLFP